MPSKWGCGGQEVPDGVSEGVIESHGSYLTTFVKESPPRNGSKYVKTGGVLMPPNWGCGGQGVPPNGVLEDRRFLIINISPKDAQRWF